MKSMVLTRGGIIKAMMEEFCGTILAVMAVMFFMFLPIFVYASYCSISDREENSRKNKDKEKDPDKVEDITQSESGSSLKTDLDKK